MRFFLKIKHQGQQLGIRRINDRSQISDTDALVKLLSKTLGVPSHDFIVRYNKDNTKLRIIPGWSLEHYGLLSGHQLEVQLLFLAVTDNQESEKGSNLPNQNSMNVVCHKEMEEIKEEQQGQECNREEDQISEIVLNTYEQLLKLIQKGDVQQFMRCFKNDHPSLGPCQNQFYHIQLKKILNQLGEKGWAAIHYAVFSGNLQIIQFLLKTAEINVNLKTSDQWIPIQLAIRQENIKVLSLLIEQPSLNINICTAHGLALIMAAQTRDISFVEALMQKDIIYSAKDHLGRTISEVVSNFKDDAGKKIAQILLKEERRQSLSISLSSSQSIFHALVTSYRGQVISVKLPPRKNKQYYLVINPYDKKVQIFENRAQYPTHPKQIIPISLIITFKKMQKKDISWYMKNDLTYFTLATNKKKYVYGCHFQQTTNRWVQAFNKCFQEVKRYFDSIQKFVRNDTVILDRIQEQKLDSPSGKLLRKDSEKDTFLSFLTSKISSNEEEETQQIPKYEPKLKQTQSVKIIKKQADPDTEQNSGKSNKNSTDSEANTPNQCQKINPFKFSDFKITKVLGEGSFGRVFHAIQNRNPEKPNQYALKCFKKKKLVVNRQIKYIVAELSILKQLQHPFIVNLHFTFQTPNYVYLGLDYCPQKDLSHHLMAQVTFPENQARIYAAEIFLALQYLHQKNIIYRDLKPENIMIAKDGHIKLVDFGLSKQGDRSNFVAKSFCGSPAYISPEMLIKKGVGKQSDYYCLGAVLYQMLVGEPPYFSEDIHTLYANINHAKLTFPKNIGSEAKNLLTRLLERNPQKRIGYKDINEIKQHAFFKQINWTDLINKKMKAPVRENEDYLDEEDETPYVQILHQDYDYSSENYRINRFMNFSFHREKS